MDKFYTYEKLQTAVENILKSKDNSVEAIYDAYLSFHTLNVDDFPQNLRLRWAKLDEELTAHMPDDAKSDGLRKSLLKKSEDTRQEIITEIIDLWKEIKKIQDSKDRL